MCQGLRRCAGVEAGCRSSCGGGGRVGALTLLRPAAGERVDEVKSRKHGRCVEPGAVAGPACDVGRLEQRLPHEADSAAEAWLSATSVGQLGDALLAVDRLD